MVTLTFSDELAEQLRELAAREGRSVEDVVRDMVERHMSVQTVNAHHDETPNSDPLVGLIGLLDEFTDATDVSSTVRES